MRNTAIALLTFCLVQGLSGQHRLDPVAFSSGGVWLRDRGDAWSALGSAPLLAMVRGMRAGVAHFPVPWGLGELAASAAVIAAPLGPGGIGAAVTRFGSGIYTETAVGVAYGAQAGALLCGAVARYTRLGIERYGSAGIAAIDAAVVVRTGSWLLWGIRVTDLNRPAVGRTGERVRESADIAAAAALPGGASFAIQAGRDISGSFDMRAAVGYAGTGFAARIGTSGSFDRIHCGLEVSTGRLGVGYGVTVHPELGWSHSIRLDIDAAP